ncbi:MAG: glycosyltransferase [Melioribacteraceae bacterium]|nr:glycosyltransferase [Melioribacteraceae bacterium]
MAIRQKYKLPVDKKIFIYFGFFNFGMNDVDTLAEAISQLGDEHKKIHFLFIGGGAKRNQFQNTINGKVKFTFLDPMPSNEIAEILPACDLSIIPLKKIEGNTGGFIPVKCLESWASGVPVLLASSGILRSKRYF